MDGSRRGTPRAEDAQGTPTQSHIPPSILVYDGTRTEGPRRSPGARRGPPVRGALHHTGALFYPGLDIIHTRAPFFAKQGPNLSHRGPFRRSPDTRRGPPVRDEKPFHRNVQRFRGGPVFKAHRLCVSLTLGLRVIKKKKKHAPHQTRFSSEMRFNLFHVWVCEIRFQFSPVGACEIRFKFPPVRVCETRLDFTEDVGVCWVEVLGLGV